MVLTLNNNEDLDDEDVEDELLKLVDKDPKLGRKNLLNFYRDKENEKRTILTAVLGVDAKEIDNIADQTGLIPGTMAYYKRMNTELTRLLNDKLPTATLPEVKSTLPGVAAASSQTLAKATFKATQNTANEFVSTSIASLWACVYDIFKLGSPPMATPSLSRTASPTAIPPPSSMAFPTSSSTLSGNSTLQRALAEITRKYNTADPSSGDMTFLIEFHNLVRDTTLRKKETKPGTVNECISEIDNTVPELADAFQDIRTLVPHVLNTLTALGGLDSSSVTNIEVITRLLVTTLETIVGQVKNTIVTGLTTAKARTEAILLKNATTTTGSPCADAITKYESILTITNKWIEENDAKISDIKKINRDINEYQLVNLIDAMKNLGTDTPQNVSWVEHQRYVENWLKTCEDIAQKWTTPTSLCTQKQADATHTALTAMRTVLDTLPKMIGGSGTATSDVDVRQLSRKVYALSQVVADKLKTIGALTRDNNLLLVEAAENNQKLKDFDDTKMQLEAFKEIARQSAERALAIEKEYYKLRNEEFGLKLLLLGMRKDANDEWVMDPAKSIKLPYTPAVEVNSVAVPAVLINPNQGYVKQHLALWKNEVDMAFPKDEQLEDIAKMLDDSCLSKGYGALANMTINRLQNASTLHQDNLQRTQDSANRYKTGEIEARNALADVQRRLEGCQSINSLMQGKIYAEALRNQPAVVLDAVAVHEFAAQAAAAAYKAVEQAEAKWVTAAAAPVPADAQANVALAAAAQDAATQAANVAAQKAQEAKNIADAQAKMAAVAAVEADVRVGQRVEVATQASQTAQTTGNRAIRPLAASATSVAVRATVARVTAAAATRATAAGTYLQAAENARDLALQAQTSAQRAAVVARAAAATSATALQQAKAAQAAVVLLAEADAPPADADGAHARAVAQVTKAKQAKAAAMAAEEEQRRALDDAQKAAEAWTAAQADARKVDDALVVVGTAANELSNASWAATQAWTAAQSDAQNADEAQVVARTAAPVRRRTSGGGIDTLLPDAVFSLFDNWDAIKERFNKQFPKPNLPLTGGGASKRVFFGNFDTDAPPMKNVSPSTPVSVTPGTAPQAETQLIPNVVSAETPEVRPPQYLEDTGKPNTVLFLQPNNDMSLGVASTPGTSLNTQPASSPVWTVADVERTSSPSPEVSEANPSPPAILPGMDDALAGSVRETDFIPAPFPVNPTTSVDQTFVASAPTSPTAPVVAPNNWSPDFHNTLESVSGQLDSLLNYTTDQALVDKIKALQTKVHDTIINKDSNAINDINRDVPRLVQETQLFTANKLARDLK